MALNTFDVGTKAAYIPADSNDQKKLYKLTGGDNLYYKSTSDVSTGDTQLSSTLTITAGTWVISNGIAKIGVEQLGASVASTNESIAGTLAVTGATTLTGAATTTGGITAANATPTQAGTWQPVAATSGTDTACSNGTAYVGSIFLPNNKTITGIQYLVGSVGGTDKVVVSLHDYNTGAVLANSATAGTLVGTAANNFQVAFTATYNAVGPKHYWIALTFNGTTAKFRSVPAHCQAGSGVLGNGVTQTFGTPATFTPPTTFTADKVPVASVY